MIRRDTERKHQFADNLFSEMKIFDLQGLLKNDTNYKCGLECYQVRRFTDIDFSKLDKEVEKSRCIFCAKLNVPYYIIFTEEMDRYYRIYKVSISNDDIEYTLTWEFNTSSFIMWWRNQQNFSQSKPMYNASKRIESSIIDKVLFENSLAWGMNIDGFSLNDNNEIYAIYEKRICTYKPPYTVENYDPNRFFKGTATRAGDFYSWNLLYELSINLDAHLFLLTFDTSVRRLFGFSEIIDIDSNGIKYRKGVKPYEKVFRGIDEFRSSINEL